MITADQRRASAGTTVQAQLQPARAQLPAATTPRPLLGVCADVLCSLLFLACGGSAALPVMWGLALHQPPLTAAGGCAVLMCAAALLNRLLAPPAARARAVPFLAALEERPWVLAACLALGTAAILVLATWWPRTP